MLPCFQSYNAVFLSYKFLSLQRKGEYESLWGPTNIETFLLRIKMTTYKVLRRGLLLKDTSSPRSFHS